MLWNLAITVAYYLLTLLRILFWVKLLFHKHIHKSPQIGFHSISTLNMERWDRNVTAVKINQEVQTVNRDLEHKILLHEQTLEFLIRNRDVKRPCQSLRIKGLNCFSNDDQLKLLSKFETLALEKAIKLKQKEIDMLKSQFDLVPRDEWHLYREPNWSDLNQHGHLLEKRLGWLIHCSNTKFKHWPAKGKEILENRTKKENKQVSIKKRRNQKKRERRGKKRLERRISKVKEESLVFNLIPPDVLEVPDAALVVLAYGEGFVISPKFNEFQFRLDAANARNKLERLANQRKKILANGTLEEEIEENESTLMVPVELLYRGVCNIPPNEHNDPLVKSVLEGISNMAETIKPERLKGNLSKEEITGYKWLQRNTKEGELVVLKADKGGAKILLTREEVSSMIRKKLTDPKIFTDIGTTNPMPKIMSLLRQHWVTAVKMDIIPLDHAKKTVGITDSMMASQSGRPSTLDVFKPGTPFFTVYPKVHKLEIDKLVPGVELPFRLVTDLSRSPTSRADRYIATNFLNDLQLEYCGDLLQDSTVFYKSWIFLINLDRLHRMFCCSIWTLRHFMTH